MGRLEKVAHCLRFVSAFVIKNKNREQMKRIKERKDIKTYKNMFWAPCIKWDFYKLV